MRAYQHNLPGRYSRQQACRELCGMKTGLALTIGLQSRLMPRFEPSGEAATPSHPQMAHPLVDRRDVTGSRTSTCATQAAQKSGGETCLEVTQGDTSETFWVQGRAREHSHSDRRGGTL